jgi:NADH-quinone oxidoreductase subunit L
MTFTGTYRGGAGHQAEQGEDPNSAASSGLPTPAAIHPTHHDDQTAHGNGHHGGAPHESPLSITFVLVVLAAGAILAGLLGLPALWTHRPPALEHWLAPSLTAEVRFAEKPHSWEWAFQGIGVAAGAVGWFFARLLYQDARSHVPVDLKKRFFRAWSVAYDKYYVDEAYYALVVRPSIFFAKFPSLGWARFLSWFDGHILDWLVNAVGAVTRLVANIDGAIDKYLVDGAVNLIASATIEGGRQIRRVQTGRIQTYLYGALAGALAVVLLNFLIR